MLKFVNKDEGPFQHSRFEYCVNKGTFHIIRDIRDIGDTLKFVNKDVEGKNPFPSNKEYFEEFYEEGNNKGKTKQIWLNKDLTELLIRIFPLD